MSILTCSQRQENKLTDREKRALAAEQRMMALSGGPSGVKCRYASPLILVSGLGVWLVACGFRFPEQGSVVHLLNVPPIHGQLC
eukprot:2410469-Rhodomonas_salina.2